MVSFAAVVLIAVGIRPPSSGVMQLGAFLGLGVGLAVLGLLDDIRQGLSPWLRVALEVAAGIIIWHLGDSAHVAGLPGWLNALLTVLWIVGVTNAFNLLDNMDGLSSGIAALTAFGIFGIAFIQHRYLVAALAIALAGCACGFLRHNFHPARIYMGDAGSLFLGFVLSVLLLKLREQAHTRVPLAVIIALATVALFDTALVSVSRLASGRSPFLGGKDHTSHRLISLGLSVRQAVAIIYVSAALFDGAAIVMAELGRVVRITGIVGIAALSTCAALILMRVDVYEEPAMSRGSGDGTLGANGQVAARHRAPRQWWSPIAGGSASWRQRSRAGR